MNRDTNWLLAVAQVMLIVAEILFVISSIGVVIGIIATLTFARGKILADLAAAGAPDGTYLAVVVLLVLVWGMLSLSMLFIRQLRAIVGTVNDGGISGVPGNRDFVDIAVNGVPHQLMAPAQWKLDQGEQQYSTPYLRIKDNSLDDVLIVGAGSGKSI